jgi:hypothetical protein
VASPAMLCRACRRREDDDVLTASEKKKFEAVSIDSASWAGLMAWSDGQRRLGCSPLAVLFFFQFLFHFSISDLFC